MDLRFKDDAFDRLEIDASFTAGLSQSVVKAFRKKIQCIRAAVDERDLYGLKALHYEKMLGARKHQRSLRLNDQYRLIVEIEGHSKGKTVVVIGIEDYH